MSIKSSIMSDASSVTDRRGIMASVGYRSSTSTDTSYRNSEVGGPDLHGSVSMSMSVETEFFEGEALYLAALETLWIAYLQPLSNAVVFSPTHSHASLEDTFGADVLRMIVCHKLILDQLVSCSSTINAASMGNEGDDESCPPSGGMESEDDPSTPPRPNHVPGDDEESFPSILLRMTPSLADAYTHYVTNFSENVSLAEAARRAVPDAIWDTSYATLARMTLREKLMPWFKMHKSPTFDALFMSFDCSFSALIALPVQRIARYSLLIQEWVKCQKLNEEEAFVCHASSPSSSPSMFTSPLRKHHVEENKHAIEAAARLQDICASVNFIRSSMECTKRLITLEQSLGMSNGGLSQHTGMTIIHESRLAKAKPKGKGVWHMKPCYAVLLDRLLLIVECFDEARSKFKRVLRVPMCSIQEVRRLTTGVAVARDMMSPSSGVPEFGFILRFVLQDSNTSKLELPFFNRRRSPSQMGAVKLEELVLMDDDELNCSLWVSELSMQVDREYTQYAAM